MSIVIRRAHFNELYGLIYIKSMNIDNKCFHTESTEFPLLLLLPALAVGEVALKDAPALKLGLVDRRSILIEEDRLDAASMACSTDMFENPELIVNALTRDLILGGSGAIYETNWPTIGIDRKRPYNGRKVVAC